MRLLEIWKHESQDDLILTFANVVEGSAGELADQQALDSVRRRHAHALERQIARMSSRLGVLRTELNER